MSAEIGHFALWLALALSILQGLLPLWGISWQRAQLVSSASSLALGQCALILLALFCLMSAYLTSDFSVFNVWQNSHALKPTVYKISGVWGNHEGSMLLWISIHALFGVMLAFSGKVLPLVFRARVLAVQAWMGSAFLLFLLFASNPFVRLDPAPVQGQGLNPVLQDLALAIHPPMLYLGYVGFSVAFSFAVAALIEGKLDSFWASRLRPWVLFAWSCLTFGIALGSWWAYYELGWGGWWFWDPVENASLMPWLAGTALLHSVMVMEKRDALKVWTVFLAITTFSFSLLGTFLVRSGLLTSVHAFAVDPTRGIFILLILVGFVGGAFLLFASRASLLRQGGVFAPISRESAVLFNNLCLVSALSSVFLGTFYPLILEYTTGERISVGPPFFNKTFGPIMFLCFLLLPFGPMLSWKKGNFREVARGLFPVGLVSVLGAFAVVWGDENASVLPFAGIALALWIVMGSILQIVSRVQLAQLSVQESFRRLRAVPRSTIGGMLAHAGLGVLVLGIVIVSAWRSEILVTLKPGETCVLAGYHITLDQVSAQRGQNYAAMVGTFTVREGGIPVSLLKASRRQYLASHQMTTEVAIATFLASQLFLTLGEEVDTGAYVVHVRYHPAVTLIWWGAGIVAFGGLLSFSGRRRAFRCERESGRTVS